jgi:formate hydrogenlyase transcriptional activator
MEMFGSSPVSTGSRRRRLLVVGKPATDLSVFTNELAQKGVEFSAEHVENPADIRQALDRGPWDAIFSSEEILRLNEQLSQENAYLLEEIQSEHNFKQIAGSSAVFLRAMNEIKAAASQGGPVLITGETGTGKELFARWLHSLSPLQNRVLVRVDCTANLSPTDLELRIELASGGTLLLDEAAELPMEQQASVVRAIQEQKTRVVAITNRDLAHAVQVSRFRADLYVFLSATTIHTPALRERREDIPGLIHSQLRRFSRRCGKTVEAVSPAALQELLGYSWPGNIREMEHVLERAVVLADSSVLEAGHLGLFLGPGSDRIEEVERRHIVRVLDSTAWVIEGERGAAARLSLHPSTLRGRMKRLGIHRQAYSRQQRA